MMKPKTLAKFGLINSGLMFVQCILIAVWFAVRGGRESVAVMLLVSLGWVVIGIVWYKLLKRIS